MIISTLKYLYEKEFQCDFPDKFKNIKDVERAKKFHKTKSGCGAFYDKVLSYKHIYKDLVFKTCPCTYKDLSVYTLIELEALYHKFGKLPGDKDLLSQPAKLIQAFKIIRSFITEKEIEDAKKEEERLKNQR